MFNTATDILLWEKVLEKVPARERELVWSYSEEARRPLVKMIVLTQILTANFMVFCALMIFFREGPVTFHAILGPDYEFFLMGIYSCMIFTLADALYKLNVGISVFVVIWQMVTIYASSCETMKTLNQAFDPENVTLNYSMKRLCFLVLLWAASVLATIYYFFSGMLVLALTVEELFSNPPNFRTRARRHPRL